MGKGLQRMTSMLAAQPDAVAGCNPQATAQRWRLTSTAATKEYMPQPMRARRESSNCSSTSYKLTPHMAAASSSGETRTSESSLTAAPSSMSSLSPRVSVRICKGRTEGQRAHGTERRAVECSEVE